MSRMGSTTFPRLKFPGNGTFFHYPGIPKTREWKKDFFQIRKLTLNKICYHNLSKKCLHYVIDLLEKRIHKTYYVQVYIRYTGSFIVANICRRWENTPSLFVNIDFRAFKSTNSDFRFTDNCLLSTDNYFLD